MREGEGKEGVEMSNVLIAEDNPTDRALLRYAWGSARTEMKMIFVRNGAEVVAYLGGEGKFADRRHYPMPEILVLDLKMPRMDGFGVLDWLETRAEYGQLEIFVLTNLDEGTVRSKVKDKRVRYFSKPADAASYISFVETLGRITSKRRAAA